MTMSNEPTVTPGEVMRQEYPLLASPDTVNRVLRLVRENLGVAQGGAIPQLDIFKLPKITNPVAGDTDFKVETATGVERAHVLTGVIVAFRQARVYYKRPYGAGQAKQPPDCSSRDGFVGEGDPGGDCTICPLAQWKSAPTGGGQACKEKREMLLLLPGQMLPHLLSITPVSLDNFLKYSLNLISAARSYWEVVTRITLEPSITASGMPIARARFQLYNRLSAEQASMLEPYHRSMLEMLTPMTVDTTPFEIVEQPGAAENAPPPGADDAPF